MTPFDTVLNGSTGNCPGTAASVSQYVGPKLNSGANFANLRSLLQGLESLSGTNLRVSLGELAGGKSLRIQLVEEAADQLAPPPMPLAV